MLLGVLKTGRQAGRQSGVSLLLWDSSLLFSLLISPSSSSSPCPRPCRPFPWLATWSLFHPEILKHQSRSCTVVYILPCKGPYPSGGVVPPSSERLIGWPCTSVCRPPPVSPPFSWASERSRLRESPSATCPLPPRQTPGRTYVQQPGLTCLPVLAREFLLPAKVASCPSVGSWPPGL